MLTVLFSGCTSSQKKTIEKSVVNSDNSQAKFSNKGNAVSMLSEDGKYRITLYSDEFPLPLNKIHSWSVHVETPSGELVENAKIRVHGGMPAHKHDYPTTPRVKQYLGNGNYKIEGVKFSMSGEWQMRLNIKEEKKLRRDRVVFIINL